MYAKSRMCRCGDGQEQQSAKPLIITGGKCNVFWGCHCDCMQEGEEVPSTMWLSVAAGSNSDGVLQERVIAR